MRLVAGIFHGGFIHLSQPDEASVMQHGIYSVLSVEIVSSYTLRVVFDDGSEQTIDFGPVLTGPLYGPIADINLFNRVVVDPETHTLVWPNGADFDPETLHDWPEVAADSSRMLHMGQRVPLGCEEPRRRYEEEGNHEDDG